MKLAKILISAGLFILVVGLLIVNVVTEKFRNDQRDSQLAQAREAKAKKAEEKKEEKKETETTNENGEGEGHNI